MKFLLEDFVHNGERVFMLIDNDCSQFILSQEEYLSLKLNIQILIRASRARARKAAQERKHLRTVNKEISYA